MARVRVGRPLVALRSAISRPRGRGRFAQRRDGEAINPTSPDSQWRAELEDAVTDALGETPVSSDLLERCLRLALTCDVADLGQVGDAFTQLLRLAGHVWQKNGPDVGERAVFAATTIAIRSFVATGNPQIVRVLADRLQQHGLTQLSLALFDEAVSILPNDQGRNGLSPFAVLQSSRGDLLRQLGHLAEGEAALVASLDAIGAC
jgi:hypothetical protein